MVIPPSVLARTATLAATHRAPRLLDVHTWTYNGPSLHSYAGAGVVHAITSSPLNREPQYIPTPRIIRMAQALCFAT